MAAKHFSTQEPPKKRRHAGRVVALVVVVVIAALVVVGVTVPSAREAALRLVQGQTAQTQSQDQSESTADVGQTEATDDSQDDQSADAQDPGTDSDDADQQADASAQEAQQAEPTPVEDTSPLDASANATVTTTTTASGISMTVPAGFETTTTYQNLESALAKITGQGYKVSFVMTDLKTGRGVSYNADAMMYPASSIKAAYCTMVLETTGGQVSSSVASTIEDCIVNSSNDAFHSLINQYGLQSEGNWLAKYAPETSSKAYLYYYPEITSTGFSNIWKEIYRYGTSGEAGASTLTAALSQSNHSPMGGLLRSRYTVWSKPGWYPADGSGDQATNDTGVVFSDCGDYVYVVQTNVPDDFSVIFPLLDALNATHGKICGGSSALLMTSSTTVSGQ
ncbi:MAG: serine hydrolase [Atopobiaceae bacterium]